MPKFRTKPFEIEAVQFTNPQNTLSIQALAGNNFNLLDQPDEDDPDVIAEVWDNLHNTWVGVKLNQWIIKGMKGEIYPCDPEVFEAKYEPSGKSPSRK